MLTSRGQDVLAGIIKPGVPHAFNEREWEFQKKMALELVFAWQDTPKARPALERVMQNIGMDRQGREWFLPTPRGGKLWIR
jgi:hypothetical protein